MIHLFGGADELPNATASFVDDESGWWVGIQRCGATLALSAALTLATSTAALATQVFSFHQDDPALSAGQYNDYDWQNPVAPIAYYVPPQVITDDQVIVPQPAPFQPDEDFWQNQVAPLVAPNIVPSPWTSDEQTPLLFGQHDEDFWNLQIQQQTWANVIPPPWGFDEQTPALYGQFDEDFWNLQIQTQFWPNVYPQPWTFDQIEVLPAPSPGPSAVGRSVRFGMSFPSYR